MRYGKQPHQPLFVAALLLLLGLVARSGKIATPAAGQAATTIETGGPYAGTISAPIAFNAFVTDPPPSAAVVWSFGDGISAAGLSVIHLYPVAGTYSVTATVYLESVPVATDSTTVVIAGTAPQVNADGPYSGAAGTPIGLAALISNAPLGSSVTWDFGDGSIGAGTAVTHLYVAPGAYTATVTVYEGGTPAASARTTVTVTQAPGPTVTYPAGWNLVAGPAGTAFTSAADPLYTFQSNDTVYQSVSDTTAAVAGRGYWAYFPTATTVSLSHADTGSASVIAPANHWLLVGNPSATATATVRGADLIMRWDAGRASYVTASSLSPGQGAWALSEHGGTITVGP